MCCKALALIVLGLEDIKIPAEIHDFPVRRIVLQKILYITLPGIMPTTVILLIMQMGSLFSSDFQKILLMYSPATYSTADVISTYTYRYGLENANYSYASAIGLMLSVISFVFVWGANAFSRKVSENSLW